MKFLSFCAALALLYVLTTTVVAQDVVPVIAPTSANNLLNLVYGALATLLATLVPATCTYVWFKVKNFIADEQLKQKQKEEIARGTIGGLGQKALGGEVGADGALKDGAIPRAAATLARNAAESFTDLGVNEDQRSAKALEVIKSNVGLMIAQAVGNPVPNPSQPIAAPSTQTVTVTPKK